MSNHLRKQTKASRHKYRPVLTASQISHILHLAKSEMPISELSFEVIASLAPFEAKIKTKAIKPAYAEPDPNKPKSFKGKTITLEDLGGTSSTANQKHEENEGFLAQEDFPTKEAYWEACYNKYKKSIASCNIYEIAAATEHMYLNDLMTPEQLAKFEEQNIQNYDPIGDL